MLQADNIPFCCCRGSLQREMWSARIRKAHCSLKCGCQGPGSQIVDLHGVSIAAPPSSAPLHFRLAFKGRLRGANHSSRSQPFIQILPVVDKAALETALAALVDPANPGAGYTNAPPLAASQQNLCTAPMTMNLEVLLETDRV
jgi:hypothetical protein